MERNNRSLGTAQEQRAADFLLAEGYELITSNFRCKSGEVDIIARDGDYLCFVEVKYRATLKAGQPESAVGFAKQRRICRVADFYLVRHAIGPSTQVRFDVVAILGDDIRLHKNAFEYIPIY